MARDVDWDRVLEHMQRTGDGSRATARALGLPEGTVLAGLPRERVRRALAAGTCPTCGQPVQALDGGDRGPAD